MLKPVALLRGFLPWMVNWSVRFELERSHQAYCENSALVKLHHFHCLGILQLLWFAQFMTDQQQGVTHYKIRCETWQMVLPGFWCTDLQQKTRKKTKRFGRKDRLDCASSRTFICPENVKLLTCIWIQQGWHVNWNKYWTACPMYCGRNF